jgi:hypothetical protein
VNIPTDCSGSGGEVWPVHRTRSGGVGLDLTDAEVAEIIG